MKTWLEGGWEEQEECLVSWGGCSWSIGESEGGDNILSDPVTNYKQEVAFPY